MVRSSSIPLVLILALLVGIANGQDLGTDICACQPRSYEFTLDFSLTCPPVNMTGDAIDATSCLISPLGDPSVEDLNPVSVESIDILELGQDFLVVSQTNVDELLFDGDTFSYTSFVSFPELIETIEQVPRAIQINMVALNALDERIINVFIVTFTNICGSYPVFDEGQYAGWTKFTAFGPGTPELCPSAPPLPTLSPSDSPVADTVSPTYSPTSEPTPEPTVAPVAPTLPPIAPVVPPTDAPVETDEPTVAPVAPTPAPISPVAPPTPAPVVEETDAPVETDEPTVAPVAPPTPAPVVEETDAPVETDKPTVAPVAPTPAPIAPVVTPTPAPVVEETDAPVETDDIVITIPPIMSMSMLGAMSMSMAGVRGLEEELDEAINRGFEFGDWRANGTPDTKDVKVRKLRRRSIRLRV